ncbi:MAG: hydroxyacid dehydrogenase [Lachnospiraceae bacterium]|nr:hydroxyacid dehydrogenase [Lachnospiraceae bacterium]
MKNIVMTQALCKEGYDILENNGTIYVADNPNPTEYMDKMATANCIVVRIGHMTKEEIEASPHLEVIGRPGVGYDSIDVDAATKRGIPIVITPSANADSVAEHTMAMIFALSSNLVEAHNETLIGNFAIRNNGKAFELNHKLLGIAGIGDIGKRVAKLAQGMNLKICAFDPAYNKEQMESLNIQYCSTLENMLEISDVITIHTPLTDETRNMFNLEHMKKMKKTSLLVNCARGGIINERDLVHALNSGIIAGAGIDVFVEEPPYTDHILFTAQNIICSPHSAAQTREAVINMATQCAQGCSAVMQGEKWTNVANPDVYNHPKWLKK